MNELRDANGLLIGWVQSGSNTEEVYDSRGQYVGYSNQNGTYDKYGTRIGSPGLFGLLLK